MPRFQLLGAVIGSCAQVIHVLIHWWQLARGFVWITVGKGVEYQWISWA
jgi:hypothetical protein